MRLLNATLPVSLLLGGLLNTFALAGDFEGVIYLQVGDPEMLVDQAWFVKGNKARQESEIEGLQTIGIVDGQRKTFINLVPEENKYFESSIEAPTNRGKDALDEMVSVRTGKTDTVAGYACEIMLSKDRTTGQTEAEICLATGFGNTAILWAGSSDLSGLSPMPVWLQDLIKQGAFPLRLRGLGETGNEEFRVETVKVERRKLAESLFAVPAGYTKVEAVSSAGDTNKPGKRKGTAEVTREREGTPDPGVNSPIMGVDNTMKQQRGK
jgi:hypothetical protein